MSLVAPPTSLPPARPTLRHRLRARRADTVPGVVVHGLPLLGRDVVLDVHDGACLELGDGCVLMDGCRVYARGSGVRVEIGPGAVLGERCLVRALAGVRLGAGCELAD